MAGTSSSHIVDPGAVSTKSLDTLQSDAQRKLLDVVDKFRRDGLGEILKLPQIVVCGNQSSGKSSVLEAITEIPFPRKENLCTRFATEIVLRRDATSSISTTINPDKNRPDVEKEILKKFGKVIHDFSELPDLMDEATKMMGLGEIGGPDSRAFSRDVLRVEICGPDRPQLTLIDLPGLIQSTNKSQTKEDVVLIRNMVREYISNELTIILAVVSAKDDFANQGILERCREVDSNGSRTLGIITKPDFIRVGSDNEKNWFELAQNRDIYFELGWHILRNRDDGELDTSFEQRNASEEAFFAEGKYQELPRSMVGISSLKTRLSQLLHNHLKKELPGLKKELDDKLKDVTEDLDRLGKKRDTLPEQRLFLTNISTAAYDLLRSAVTGNYADQFFSANMNAAIDAPENIRRLRAVIQHLNIQFAAKMRKVGSKYRIGSPRNGGSHSMDVEIDSEDEEGGNKTNTVSEDEADDTDTDSIHDDTSGSISAPLQKNLSRQAAVSWVLQVLQRSRGSELPGNFNPMLISQLFWEQSERWEMLAMKHIERVASVCDEFVRNVLQHAATPEIVARLLELRVEAALASSLKASKEELQKIIIDKASHPMTYNHYYTTTIQKMRQEKYSRKLMQMTNDAKVSVDRKTWEAGPGYSRVTYIDPNILRNNIDRSIELDMDKFSAEEALDSQIAYYKDELKYFIAAITKQVIERHLVSTLPLNILSPSVVVELSDEDISYIAAEPAEITHRRAYLETRKATLEKGITTFRRAIGGR
ncbi:Dynamin family protein [Mytilinidion resinicola]|uniref:Dynamin family protein n=1 Tax=Mytilinidion resinicola TaxID=574789 RepID=A0A6A6YR50_9PEZI|nr:Dynamin family protein [Mytilinidion resinicola]KAF2810357.1 Dynamin family protein [Mytilinidion resinicola]